MIFESPLFGVAIVTATLAAIMALAACSDSSKRAKLKDHCATNPARRVCLSYREDPGTQEFFAAAVGRWKAPCFKKGANGFQDDFYEFSKNLKYTHIRTLYTDADCTQALYIVIDSGSLRATKVKGVFDYQLDLAIDTAIITPLSVTGATVLASSRACGKADWESSKSHDLAMCTYAYKQGEVDEEEFSIGGMETFTAIKLNTAAKQILMGDEGANLYIPKLEDRPKVARETPYVGP